MEVGEEDTGPIIDRVPVPKDIGDETRTFLVFMMMLVGFMMFNTFFALVYMIPVGGKSTGDGGFADCFYLSVQTLSTVGYGKLVPETTYANVVSIIQIMLLLSGVVSGATFLSLSRRSVETLQII